MVVAMAGGRGRGQNMAMVEANGGMEVVGCEGASGLPRKSQHNRHAHSSLRRAINERQNRFN